MTAQTNSAASAISGEAIKFGTVGVVLALACSAARALAAFANKALETYAWAREMQTQAREKFPSTSWDD